MKPITTPTKRSLRKARDILQNAHDLIETLGFDIDTYGDEARDETPTSEMPTGIAPMCYIGNVRYAAGVDPDPATTIDGMDASAGDGPELVTALRILDDIAKPELDEIRQADSELYAQIIYDWSPDRNGEALSTGRFIEALGFAIQAKVEREIPTSNWDHDQNYNEWALKRLATIEVQEARQQEYALGILRRALTELETKLAHA